MAKKYYIAWNETKTEGFITDCKADAQSARTGKKRREQGFCHISTVAEAFYNAYDDQKLPHVQEVEI